MFLQTSDYKLCLIRCRWDKILRTRTPKLTDQRTAIRAAIPPINTWLESLVRKAKLKARPQQPSAIMPGKTRFCTLSAAGDASGFLRAVLLIVGAVGAVAVATADCMVPFCDAVRCAPLVLFVVFLRFLAFAIPTARLHCLPSCLLFFFFLSLPKMDFASIKTSTAGLSSTSSCPSKECPKVGVPG
jgi:hypothetical protein